MEIRINNILKYIKIKKPVYGCVKLTGKPYEIPLPTANSKK